MTTTRWGEGAVRCIVGAALVATCAACGATPSRASTVVAPVAGAGSDATAVGSEDAQAPGNPYPDTLRYLPPPPRSPRVVTRSCPDGGSAPVLDAVLGRGAGDQERDKLQSVVLCPSGLVAVGRALAGVGWARSAANDYTAVEYDGGGSFSGVGMIHEGRATTFRDLGGYATSHPVPFDDGSFTYQLSDSRGMRVAMRWAGGRIQSLGTTGAFYGGSQYSPSGKLLVTLSAEGVPGAYPTARLMIAESRSKTRSLTVPFSAVNLLVLNDRQAMVAGASDDPNGNTFIVDLHTGFETPLQRGYYAIAADPQREQVLMKSYDGRLFWLSLATKALTPIAGGQVLVSGWRVVGGDLQRAPA